tara:strand:- start:1159 stop:1773 length:615 start_codon:yes stop_codon:yes gene_type:complete
MINFDLHILTNNNEGKHDMKYQEIKTLLDRHPELDSEVLDMDEVREYLIYGNDGQKVIAQVISLDYEEEWGDKENALLDCFVGRDLLNIPIDEIRSMELVVKFDELPNKCFVINPINEMVDRTKDEMMPVSIVKLGVKGYFESSRVVSSKDELMALNREFNMTPFEEVMNIMLDQSMFPADADHIIKHKYDAKLRLTKSEREAI